MTNDISPGPAGSGPSHLAYISGVLYFSADDGVHCYELWKSDDTGKNMVQDINSGITGSFPESISYLEGGTFFTAFSDNAGRELWATNGSASGTVLFKDLRSGTASSEVANMVVMEKCAVLHG